MVKYGNLKRAESFFEEFLRKERVCFLKENEFSSRTLTESFSEIYSLYTVFLSSSDESPEKLNIVLSSQESFGEVGTFSGYIMASLGTIDDALSKSDITNSLFCAFSEKENKLIFKPIVYMMKYWNSIELHAKRRPYPIRIDPATKEELEINRASRVDAGLKVNPCKEVAPSPYKRSKEKINGFYSFVLSYNSKLFNKLEILHKKIFVIMQNEMKTFLSKYNNYPSMWKLKFKTTKNILGE